MIIVRDSSQIRFGKIDQAADHFRGLPEMFSNRFPEARDLRFELLADVSGAMYTLHEYSEFPSIQGWEYGLQKLVASAV